MSQPPRPEESIPVPPAAAAAPVVAALFEDADIADDEQAAAARLRALGLYNEGRFEDAIKVQYKIVEYMTEEHGELDPKCGLSYLDYGVTLLALIQSMDPAQAALAANLAAPGEAGAEEPGVAASGEGETTAAVASTEGPEARVQNLEEDMTLCFANLDAARVCFQNTDPADSTSELRLAEAHDAIGQLHVERDDEESAITEFETALMLRRVHLPPNDRLIIATLFSIAQCYVREENYDTAETKLTEAIRLAEAHVGYDKEDVADMKQMLTDIAEVRASGGMDAIRKEIREQFVDESSQVADPEAVLGDAVVTPGVTKTARAPSAGSAAPSHPFASAVPGGADGAEASISFFQPLGAELPAGSQVHSVQVRKKTQRSSESQSNAHHADDGLPPAKVPRTENGGDSQSQKKLN